MANNSDNGSNAIKTGGSGAAGQFYAVSADVYERRSEYVFMTKDDFETFEARMQDKDLFKGLAIFLLAAGVPLGVEKFFDWQGSADGADLGILVTCVGASLLGLIFGWLAHSRESRVATFKRRLFSSERLVASNVTMFPMRTGTSGDT